MGIRKAIAVEVSKAMRRHQNRGVFIISGQVWRVPVYWPGGVRHRGNASLICCFHAERGKAFPDTSTMIEVLRGRVSSGRNREGLSTVAGVLADLFVVAEKLL